MKGTDTEARVAATGIGNDLDTGTDDAGSSDRGAAHPLVEVVERLEAVLVEARLEFGAAVSALSAEQLRDVVQRAWRIVRQVQGSVVVPAVAEAAERRLFRREGFSAASSMRDLVAGWLRCHPSVAGRLLRVAKHCVTGGFRATGDVLAAGEIDLDHARAVVRSVRRLPAGVMDETEYRRAESTMLDTAKVTDPEVTEAAGQRLLEVLAPEAAQEFADRRAERDRERAEASRWFEVTGIGIAGCKELRLRAESDTIDALVRVITGLTEPATVDDAAIDPDHAWQPGQDPAGDTRTDTAAVAVDAASGDAPSAAGAGAVREVGVVVADGPGQFPGMAAEGGAGSLPLERRRADAAVEVIDAVSGPDLLDDLTPQQLRRLADQLEDPWGARPGAPTVSVARPGVPGQGAVSAEDGGAAVGSGVSDACGVVDGGTADLGGGNADTDAAFGEIVDAGQIMVDTCVGAEPDDAVVASASTVVPDQRSPIGSGALDDGPGNRVGVRVGDRRAARGARRMVRRGSSGVRGERPSLVVMVPYGERQRALRSGEVSSTGSPVRLASSTEIERLACEATITPVWMTGQATPVAVAAPTRFFRGRQLAALIARDRGCVFPGCGRGLRYAHAHHIVPWSRGGPTTVENGVLLCSHHHRVVHRSHGWLVRMAADGLPDFVPPAWIDPERRAQRHARHRTGLPLAA